MKSFYTETSITLFSNVFSCIEYKYKCHPMYDVDIMKEIFHYTLYDKKVHTLKYACSINSLDIVKYLVEQVQVSITDTDMNAAISSGNVNIVKYLVTTGANIDVSGCVLLLASNLKMIKYLVSQGADIHWEDETILTLACIRGDLETVKYLVSMGANIGIDDFTPLLAAIELGKLEVVKYLVSTGAIVDQEALDAACFFGYLEVVKYFFPLRFSPTERHLLQAVSNGKISTVKYISSLLSSTFDYTESFLRAAERGHLDVVKYLVHKGVNVNARDGQATYLAYRKDDSTLFNYLISIGGKSCSIRPYALRDHR